MEYWNLNKNKTNNFKGWNSKYERRCMDRDPRLRLPLVTSPMKKPLMDLNTFSAIQALVFSIWLEGSMYLQIYNK